MRIVTHNGKIHPDQVCATALLTAYLSRKFAHVYVIRTRDKSLFLSGDIIVGVGNEYKEEEKKYDHHQLDFEEYWDYGECKEKETQEKPKVLLSCAGLIWRHYGSKIIEMYLDDNSDFYDSSFNFSEQTITDLLNIIYDKILIHIDAHENGVVFPAKQINIPEIINALNSNYIDEETQTLKFNRAVRLVGDILDIQFADIISNYFNYQRDLGKTANLLSQNSDKFLYVKNIPTVFKCLHTLDPDREIVFCIFQDSKEQYTVKTRRNEGDKHDPICRLISYDEMRVLGVNTEDIIFIHKGRYIAKTKTLESAITLINLSLEIQENIRREIEEIGREYQNQQREIETKFLKELEKKRLEPNSLLSVISSKKQLVTGVVLGSVAAASLFYLGRE